MFVEVVLLVHVGDCHARRTLRVSCYDQFLGQRTIQVSKHNFSETKSIYNLCSDGIWLSVCIVVVVAINLCGAGVYGEAEFIFASIKVITIIGLIVSYSVFKLSISSDNVLELDPWHCS